MTNEHILASNKHTGWKHYHLAIAGDKHYHLANAGDNDDIAKYE